MLFNSIVYGPIHSRRLGNSLGINIMPPDQKFCSFNCIYCECGWNTKLHSINLPTKNEIIRAIQDSLTNTDIDKLDVITFSGNGEPTLHKDFLPIIKDTVELRNKYCPHVKISVLSNATQLFRPDVREALWACDNRILKLDSAIDETMKKIDQPNQTEVSVKKIIDNLAFFNGDFILQICFLKGMHNNYLIDNTTEKEVIALYNAIDYLHPKQIMMYVIDRKTPCENLEKIDKQTMETIATPLRKKGYDVMVCC